MNILVLTRTDKTEFFRIFRKYLYKILVNIFESGVDSDCEKIIP
jgi:hypothetical protein